MGKFMLVIWILLAVVVVGLGYIRLAPSDPARWHTVIKADKEKTFKQGVIRLPEAGSDGLARLDAIIRRSPRTTVLAGSVDEGMITYVTRSRVFGFPDYSTVRQDGDRLVIYARSRFGRSDTGVNRRRVEGWLADLKP